jgi:hypothetical protein
MGGEWEMCRGEEKSMQKLDGLTGDAKEMESFWRQRGGWNDNIKIDCKCIELEEVEWIDLARGRDKWWAYRNVNVIWFLWL